MFYSMAEMIFGFGLRPFEKDSFLNSRREALIRPLLFTQKQHPSHHNSWQFSREAAGGNREVFCGCSLLGRRGPRQSGNVCTALAR